MVLEAKFTGNLRRLMYEESSMYLFGNFDDADVHGMCDSDNGSRFRSHARASGRDGTAGNLSRNC